MATNRRRMDWLVIASVAAISFVVSAIPTVFGSIPLPAVHDEFSYLLAADTFAHGRLTNPPLPMWRHFEAFHEIQQPTYASKFPPAQGMAMAIGEKIWHPILGVWISVALACAAATWLMLAWLPRRWALLGGIVALASPIVQLWSQTYWGGGVAMIGGALLAGAASRMVRRPSVKMGTVAGIGAAILGLSRPFEGLVFGLIVAILLIATALRRKRLADYFLRAALPIGAIVIMTVGWMMYYDWRVTGKPLLIPYMAHQRLYMIAPQVFWQRTNPLHEYSSDILRRFYTQVEYNEYARQMNLRGYFAGVGGKVSLLLTTFVLPWTLAVPLLAGLFMFRRSRAARWAAIGCLGLPIVQMLCSPWMRNQYMAPAAGCFFLLAALGLWRLDRIRWGRKIVIALVSIQLIWGMVWGVMYYRTGRAPFGRTREMIIDHFRQMGGRHLLIVRYSPTHPTGSDLVFNPADLNSTDVIFAHDLGDAKNQELADYFRDRRSWLIEADEQKITPLPATTQPASSSAER